MELHGQYSSSDTVNNRWDDEWDNENSSARLFERSRIKALAGRAELILFELKIMRKLQLRRRLVVTEVLLMPLCTTQQLH
ncbi:hypothetical protein XENOCAPTIV_003662 [Xenoophorus captivus]|uniref:Uncharacterized protein n=1 Tax=Xenoophorus captivus TaxID=1517983 RepID=A0ABV0RXF8_9TELE